MDDNLRQTLIKKYNKIFSNDFIFEIDDGWYQLIDKVCSDIQNYIDTSNHRRVVALEFNMMLGDARNDKWDRFEIWYKKDNETSRQKYRKGILELDFQPVNELVEQVVADQIKEKFGTLRFYFTGGDQYTTSLIDQAEIDSEKICEYCGNPGSLDTEKSWLKTLCEEHKQERHNNGT